MDIVLAFDIERSGGTAKYDTIALGASVLNSEFEELDSLFVPNYFPSESKFEKKCWDEFWCKQKDQLELLKYDGPLSKDAQEKEMVEQFQCFRKKWEIYACENEFTFTLASDNNVFDGGFMNDLIYKHFPDVYPIPYLASTQEYGTFYETTSQQKGLLSIVDPSYVKQWGMTDRIKSIYATSPEKYAHDHHPAHDAYSIAFDQQVIFGIQKDIIRKRT
jgi:hypothetical protein